MEAGLTVCPLDFVSTLHAGSRGFWALCLVVDYQSSSHWRLSAQHDSLMNNRTARAWWLIRPQFGFSHFFNIPDSQIVGVQRDMIGYLSRWSNIVALTDKAGDRRVWRGVNRNPRSLFFLILIHSTPSQWKRIIILTHITGHHSIKVLHRWFEYLRLAFMPQASPKDLSETYFWPSVHSDQLCVVHRHPMGSPFSVFALCLPVYKLSLQAYLP